MNLKLEGLVRDQDCMTVIPVDQRAGYAPVVE
jgi:hypothetical protein